MVFVGERSIPSDCGSDNVCSPQVRILSITHNREPTLCKLFVVKFKLWSCSQPSLILNLWIWGLINLWKWLFLQLVRKQPIQFLESKRKTDINVRILSIKFVIFWKCNWLRIRLALKAMGAVTRLGGRTSHFRYYFL